MNIVNIRYIEIDGLKLNIEQKVNLKQFILCICPLAEKQISIKLCHKYHAFVVHTFKLKEMKCITLFMS